MGTTSVAKLELYIIPVKIKPSCLQGAATESIRRCTELTGQAVVAKVELFHARELADRCRNAAWNGITRTSCRRLGLKRKTDKRRRKQQNAPAQEPRVKANEKREERCAESCFRRPIYIGDIFPHGNKAKNKFNATRHHQVDEVRRRRRIHKVRTFQPTR